MTATDRGAAIRQATRDDADHITRLLAEAFHDGPVADWLVPDEGARRRVYLDYFAIFVDDALRRGFIHATADLTGVALWYPRIEPLPEPVNYDARLAAACGRWLDRFLLLDAAFNKIHPAWPHHYLAFLAVTPKRQGVGIGGALLRHQHAALAALGLPAYLEASNARNRNLYLRHGYQASGPVPLPDNGPPIWPMRYDPPTPSRPAAAGTATQPGSSTAPPSA
jgi:GNAT superfamily N-acetyltransferase